MKQNYFTSVKDEQGIVVISVREMECVNAAIFLDAMEELASTIVHYTNQSNTIGVLYHPPFKERDLDYKGFTKLAQDKLDFEKRLYKLLLTTEAIQKQSKTVIAIVDGSCFGPILSAALWAHKIIATKDSKFGFPEVKYAVLPAWGASFYVTKKIELPSSISLLTQGRVISAQEAESMQLVDKITAGYNEAVELAKAWVMEDNPKQKKHNSTFVGNANWDSAANAVKKKHSGENLTTDRVLSLIKLGLQSDFRTAVAQEVREYRIIWANPITINMLRCLYYGVEEARSAQLTSGFKLRKLGVVGAGMMGSGIAYEAARAGVQVVLKDVNLAQAEHGKAYSLRASERLIKQGVLSTEQQQRILDQILPTTNTADLADSDLIIEAVFEDRELKANVTLESLPYLNKDGFFASNTTSLPITELAKVGQQADKFIGMHFFSPVDRMPLVEIIKGKDTSAETLDRALAVARTLGKTPIVVNDGPAFFTSRIFFNYLLEAVSMLLEGIPTTHIEEQSLKAGFAVGPLAVLDEISLPLMLHVYDQLPSLHSSQKRCYTYLSTLITAGRTGRKAGKGFYDYESSSRNKSLWQDTSIALQSESKISGQIIQKRLLHVMALDSFRCLQEGVLSHPLDGDIGSILGVGYASQTGGVFGHIDQVGIKQFIKDCQSFTDFGEQWDIPQDLLSLGDKNFRFYDGFKTNWKR